MGLLTDPSEQERLPKFIIAYHNKLCVLSYVIGIIWFLHLNLTALASVYFSENALLPGLVDLHFRNERDAASYYESLKTEAERFPGGVPQSWLVAAFTQLGLETYTHDFVLNNPLGTGRNMSGTNIYAILRAPRTANTEALLLCAPYRPIDSTQKSTLSGIAIMLAAAKHFKKYTYWAKDIIFLITQHEQLGIQAWLDAYHQTDISSRVIQAGDLSGRSGSIQAALNLEMAENKINHFDIKIEGLNGRLPNLDFFNLACRLAAHEGFRVTFKDQEELATSDMYLNWKRSLKILTLMMRSQATGTPTGNHGLFHRYRIEALTLEGKVTRRYGRLLGYAEMGLMLESIFRSLNNLLERFHQSYFFYLLPSNNWFVSIGLYMPAFAALAVGIVIKAIALRIETNRLTEIQAESIQAGQKLTEIVDYSFKATIPIFVLANTVGFLLYMSPAYVVQIGYYFRIKPEVAISSGIFAIYIAILLLPAFISLKYSSNKSQSWKVLKCITLLQLGLLTLSIAFINFSLAFIITVIYAPICIGISPSQSRFARWMKGLPVLLISPLGLLFLFTAYDTINVFPDIGGLKLVERSLSATRSAVLYSIHDEYIYGNWMFLVASTCLLPTWLQFWIITQTKITK
uniref:Glycosylphosphatidylinositol anchor attachment 1 protein n=1 Tax=Strigamia maritima TaxID=126957 RepID=T1J4Z4_STRMM